jgi:hypothetical protein
MVDDETTDSIRIGMSTADMIGMVLEEIKLQDLLSLSDEDVPEDSELSDLTNSISGVDFSSSQLLCWLDSGDGERRTSICKTWTEAA